MQMSNNYRIYRVDIRNIAIQKKRPSSDRWDTISYHGNSLHSLRSGLLEMIMRDHIPCDDNLLKQLKRLELGLSSSVDRIEKMVKDFINVQ